MQLNPQQSEIVNLPQDQSCLVIAGAGSGKTAVIAHKAIRTAKLLVDGRKLQMLTFSNKAAKEMKARVQRVNGIIPHNILMDTFHSYGMKLIKSDPEGFGLAPEFNLLSETDVKRSLRALAHDLGLPKKIDPTDKKRLNPMNWLNTWSLKRQAGYDVRNHSKNKVVLCEALQATHKLTDQETELAWNTLTCYENQKQQTNCLDFDDLIFLPLLRVTRDLEFLDLVRSELGALIIDEYQDTNRVQYGLIAKIAKGFCSATAVGDDDQSIYGWRGAEVKNLTRFQNDFGAKTLRLEQNYRSTKSIVNTAHALIQHNEGRLDKTPFSNGEEGEALTLNAYPDHWAMVREISEGISRLIESGVPAQDIAILYRTNRMAGLIEPALRRERIPYHVVGGMSLFDRAEVAAITNAVRLARNPQDVHALKSLAPYIDGFGDTSCYAVCDWLVDTPGASLYELPEAIENVPKRGISALKGFMDDLQSEALLSHTATEFVNWVISGPMAILDREKDEQIREKKEQHVKMLAHNIEDELRDRLEAGEELTWRDIAVEIALRDAGQTEGSTDQITLSTIHRSKGLEYPYVLLVGMSEGLMPLDARSDISDEDAGYSHMEEERRLGYVGITRAKVSCEFFHSARYAFPGSDDDKIYEPSRFLDEMGYSCVNDLDTSNEDDQDFAPGSYNDVRHAINKAMGMSN
jgi:superfamily I DNA/RNA helicase